MVTGAVETVSQNIPLRTFNMAWWKDGRLTIVYVASRVVSALLDYSRSDSLVSKAFGPGGLGRSHYMSDEIPYGSW